MFSPHLPPAWALAIPGFAALVLLYIHRSYRGPKSLAKEGPAPASLNMADVDPPLLKAHSTFESYITSYAVYPSVRTFYHAHPHADKMPKEPSPLPMLVFVHGLGGSMAQFAPLLGSLINVAPCLGIDLPGCGLSQFSPTAWDAYTTEALVDLYQTVIEKYLAIDGSREVVLIAHSMGCSLGALLASTASPISPRLQSPILGMVAICPKGSPPTQRETATFRPLLALPDFILDGIRWFDRRGGSESASVKRFVGNDAGIDLKKLQERFNMQSKTAVWKRMARGCLPSYDSQGLPHGGFPGLDIWAGIDIPILLVAGEADPVTKQEEIAKITSCLERASKAPKADTRSAAIPEASINSEKPADKAKDPLADDTKFGSKPSTALTETTHSSIVKSAILPSPASHALLYDHATYRTVAGLIEDFLSRYVSSKLSLGWQLQHLTTSGKWDVKNLAKWKGVAAVSGPIDGGLFRGLKTLREQDEEHTPSVFVKEWSNKIYAIIDISHDTPIYDTKVLDQGGIQYHKFPTVSKIPPTVLEVQDFIALIERLRKEIEEKYEIEDQNDRSLPAIGVHCHYGYNRTGFFMVCYMVEKRGYTVQDAIDEFAKQRPPGIRHDHFIDTLFVRYCVGLRRASTTK